MRRSRAAHLVRCAESSDVDAQGFDRTYAMTAA
jgi:hypothetical protein